MSDENHRALLDEARHRSKRDIEEIVARLRPRPDVPASLRKVTISVETRDKLRLAQDLLRHAVPDGDPAAILDRALTLLVAQLQRARQKKTRRTSRSGETVPQGVKRRVPPAGGDSGVPEAKRASVAEPCGDSKADRPATTASGVAAHGRSGITVGEESHGPRDRPKRSRHIPAAVVRQVWERDAAQCTFIGGEGRCRERACLELHHLEPFAAGGPANVNTLTLRCRAHNAFDAVLRFGADRIAAARRVGNREGEKEADTPAGSRSGPS